MASLYERILIATDLSESSYHMLICLGGLHRVGTAHAILLHSVSLEETGVFAGKYLEMIRPALKRQAKILEDMGFMVTTEMAMGLPQFEIARVAEAHDCSVIVVGAQGGTLEGEAYLGGVAAAVIYSALRPVLVLRVPHTEGEPSRGEEARSCYNFLQHVLFPTDFSSTAERAFQYLVQMVRTGCKMVTLLHVQEKSRIGRHLESRLEEFNRIDLERLEKKRQTLVQMGAYQVNIQIPYGSAIMEVLDRSRSGTYSMIIIGSQGRSFISELFLGSVSHNVAQKAPIPVLLIPASSA